MLFDFLQDLGNHDERKIDTYEKDSVFVDTCAVSDSTQPYETAVAHPNYNDGTMIIVQLYNTKEAAQKGHNKWVKKMTAEILPKAIKDVSTAGIIKFAADLGVDLNEIHLENPT
jgi:hypothetical protein